MSEHVNQMLEIVKDISKNIARMKTRMQDLLGQMIEVIDNQSNVILEIKKQSKVKGSQKFQRIKVMYQ